MAKQLSVIIDGVRYEPALSGSEKDRLRREGMMRACICLASYSVFSVNMTPEQLLELVDEENQRIHMPPVTKEK